MKNKKIMSIIVFVMAFMLFVPSAFAVNITGCESMIPGADIDVKIANTVHLIITIIKVAIPVVLVIFGMIDFLKAITAQKEDEIKKGQQIFIKRLIAAVLVFFVITIVQLVVSLAADSTEKEGIMTCANCFLKGANKTTGSCKK